MRNLPIGYGKARSRSGPDDVFVVRRAARFVEPGEHVGVFVVDDPALDLHGRRQLAVHLGEVVAEDREALDLLDPRELPVDPVDLLLELCVDLRIGGDRYRVGGDPNRSASFTDSSRSRVSIATRYGRLSP